MAYVDFEVGKSEIEHVNGTHGIHW
jgi:hypothetical protein